MFEGIVFNNKHRKEETQKRNSLASARSNWASIPTDCPTRERAGWLGDAQLSAETVLRAWGGPASGAHGAYRLFCELMALSRADDDNLPDVVPFLGGHGGAGERWDELGLSA